MFLDRSDLIQPIIVHHWEAPQNTTYLGILWRFLSYYSEMATARRKIDIPTESISPHSFRSYTATDLLLQRVAKQDVQHLLGHADPRVKRLYDCRQKHFTRNIVERISV
jgi:integrase